MITKQFHISKIIKLTVIVLVILGCSNQGSAIDNLKEGKYAWKKRGVLENTFLRLIYNSGFEIGDTLTILDNDNFAYTSCGEYGFGKYKIINDSLYLNFDSSATQRDSIMLYEKFTYTYYIKDSSTLSRELKLKLTKESKETFKGISELHFIEDTLSK